MENQTAENARNLDEELEKNGELEDWVPPENQTGDGMTNLNAKFGY